MTDQERAIYDRMSPREQRAIDALYPENQSAAILTWARINAKRLQRERPQTRADDDSDRRHP